MRLTPAQIATIQSTAQALLGGDAQVWLYGSRLDDKRKGGDIDLLIESSQKASIMNRAKIKYHVEAALQLPVDILMVQTGQVASPFEAIARKRAVSLTPLIQAER
jgi:predicted nucleotidyltransferase